MIKTIGEIEFPDEMNIPVNSFIYESDANDEKYPNKWRWEADNFMPRKAHVSHDMFELIADTKEEIIDWVRKYVVPLYINAMINLSKRGENYYWELKID